MANIFGMAGLNASDYQFMRQAGQELIYEASRRYMGMVADDMARAVSVFVSQTTETFKERYQLPGGGRMSERATGTRGAAVRAVGSWDVAYPLYDFDELVVADSVDFAYMTPAEYERHVDTVVNRYRNQVRYQILHMLFDNVNTSFVDKRNGTLTCVPLANGDSVVYPPVVGSDSEATENHYLESGYAASAISDTNNPCVTLVNELEEHFGDITGGSNIALFINNAQAAKIGDLTNFVEVPDNRVVLGDNADVPVRLPSAPGRILGLCDGAWIIQWRYVPAGWALAVHLDEEAPLKMRIDPAETGLPQGLNLVARDSASPLESAEWRARFGVGVANRLNGVVMEFGTGGTYTIPTTLD